MNGPHQQMTKPKFVIQKSRLETYLLRIFDQNHGLTLLEIFFNFFNYIKMIFLLSISSLPLRKQHHQKSKPRSLLQKSSLERYLELLTKLKGLEICYRKVSSKDI